MGGETVRIAGEGRVDGRDFAFFGWVCREGVEGGGEFLGLVVADSLQLGVDSLLDFELSALGACGIGLQKGGDLSAFPLCHGSGCECSYL